MDRAVIAKACGVDEAWLDGWNGEPIGIYPARGLDSGTYERVSRTGDAPAMWTLDIGVRTKLLTSLEASRIRYALDRLCVPHVGRPPVKREGVG